MEEKYFFYEGEINETFLTSFLSLLNENPNKKINVILTSSGGFIYVGDVIVDIINKDPARFSFMGGHILYSTAFYIYLRVKCEKNVTDATTGMFHLTETPIKVNYKGLPTNVEDKFSVKKLSEIKHLDDKYIKDLGFSVEQIESLEKGECIFFSAKEMRELKTLEH